jgi:hypothetical protein
VTVKDVYRCTVRGGRLGDEVTSSQTPAILVQSIADRMRSIYHRHECYDTKYPAFLLQSTDARGMNKA